MFTVFGFTICLTVFAGFVFAMVVFGAMMHIVGPEKGFCTIGAKKEED